MLVDNKSFHSFLNVIKCGYLSNSFSRPPPVPRTPPKLVSFDKDLKAFLFVWTHDQNMLDVSLIHCWEIREL